MTQPRDIGSLYIALVETAEKIIGGRRVLDIAPIEELACEIDVRVAVPAGDRRLIHDEEKLLAACLLRVVRAQLALEERRAMLYRQIAGVLLPAVQEHFSEALAARRNSFVPTTDQDYQRRR